jgi:hypothetical protein
VKKSLVIVFVILLVGSVFLIAQEQLHNDPLDIISNLPRPNVLIMMDTSGSMLWDSVKVAGVDMTVRKENLRGGSIELLPTFTSFTSDSMKSFLIDSDNTRSRIGQAKRVIQSVAYRYTNMNFGLGAFTRTLKLNRFRGYLAADYNQNPLALPAHSYEYYDDQKPPKGEINIPIFRKSNATQTVDYPYIRVLYSDADVYWAFDPTDVIWSETLAASITSGGNLYQRLDWDNAQIENARYQMFNPLTADGDFIYRDAYVTTDATHRNKLNQVKNIDIFLTDAEMLALKESTPLGDDLVVRKFITEAWGLEVNETITFTHHPVISDWDRSTACASAEILIGLQDRTLDDPYTAVDESENRDFILAAAGDLSGNAKYYDAAGTLSRKGALYGIANTPLADSLQAAGDYYSNVAIARDVANLVGTCRDNYIIMLTDGVESCGGNPVAIAADLLTNLEIKTYVIAFTADNIEVDAIAAAGGTLSAYKADTAEELLLVFDEIFNDIHSELISPPLPVSASGKISSYIDFDSILMPFFDFPGFYGHVQARTMLRLVVAQKDPDTGDLVVDADGDPIIIEDNLTEDRVLALIEDEADPIQQDPAKEIVGIRYDHPIFKWDAGELLSLETIEPTNPDLVYAHLKVDSSDLDGDGDTTEVNVNPAYKTADERTIYTALDEYSVSTVVNFDVATLMDGTNNTATKYMMGADAWSDDEVKFLINYTRGKEVQRFAFDTTLYGINYSAGDPIPAGADGDGDGVPDDFSYEERYWKLGDTNGSTMVVIQPPGAEYPYFIDDDGNGEDDYEEFVLSTKDNPVMTIVGANDGMLHAFTMNGIDGNDDGDFDDSGEFYPGAEVWAYVLPTTMGKLKNLYNDSATDQDYLSDGQQLDPHQYFADGEITLALVRARVHTTDTDNDGKSDDPEFRLMMFFGESRGGNHYWAFDVTDPTVPQPVWTMTDSAMGNTISRPAIGALEVGSKAELDNDTFQYYAFMGSGYDYTQVDGSATVGNVFYMVDITNGYIINQFSVGDESGGAGIPNAIPSRAVLADVDNDYFVERAYIADLDGNIWRWDFIDYSVVNIMEGITTETERLDRPIYNSITYANVFGNNVVMAATGNDTRVYLDADDFRSDYDKQRIYMIADKDSGGMISSMLDGEINGSGDYEDTGSTVGVDLPEYAVAGGILSVNTYSEFTEEGTLARGFQLVAPLYTPDALGLKAIQCISGDSSIVILDVSFGAAGIISTAEGTIFELGEGKQAGVSYAAGSIITGVGNELKVIGSKTARFEAFQSLEARLKVLSWKEIF